MIDTDVLFRIADAAEGDGRLEFARLSFEHGAALGDEACLTRLAHMHDVGIGTPVDKALAMRLYQRAWRRARSVVAANNIAILYRERGRHRTMAAWFRRAAETGDGSAELDLAKCYIDGVGVRKDAVLGLRHLKAAVQSDYICEDEREEAVLLMATLAPRAL